MGVDAGLEASAHESLDEAVEHGVDPLLLVQFGFTFETPRDLVGDLPRHTRIPGQY
jgi:hypothetical protein